MNRKQRRHMKSLERKKKKKLHTVEKKMGTDFDKVTDLALRIEKTGATLETIQQAIQEIPTAELNRAKLLADVEVCGDQLKRIREEGGSMGLAVRNALDEAVAKSGDAVETLRGLLAEGVQDDG